MITRPLSRSEVRDVDRRAIEQYGLPGVVLMENAGRGAAELLVHLRISGRVVICAGKGNNGGDGFVIARHLELRAIPVQVLLFCHPGELTGDAAINYRVLVAGHVPVVALGAAPDLTRLEQELLAAEWIVDALLGTGAQGEVREPLRAVIAAINAAGRKVLAIDLPSGLDCDTGRPLGLCVRADHTATFVAPKLGFSAPGAGDWTGIVRVVEIGVPQKLLREVFENRICE